MFFWHYTSVFRYLCIMNRYRLTMKMQLVVNSISRALVLASMVVAMVLLAGCHREVCSHKPYTIGEGKHKAVATIEPLRYFVSRIGGEEWEVAVTVPRGFSPEEFMPSASQMVDLAQAECLFKVGELGFETTWLNDALEEMENLQVYDTSAGINRATFDPHTWTSPHNVKIICTNIAKALAEVDAGKADVYKARLEKTLATVDSVDNVLRGLLAEVPSRSFVIAHPALSLFAEEYGLKQIAIEADGKEPTAASIENLIAQARKDSVKVIFVQEEFSEQSALVIAAETGAKIVKINPLAYDWPSEMIRIGRALK